MREEGVPVNLIYNVLVVVVHILHKQNTGTTFPARLRVLVESVDDDTRVAMGFPSDWRDRPVFNL